MKKITAVMWHSHTTTLRRARELVQDVLEVKVYSARFMDEGKDDLAAALEEMAQADLIFFYRSASETIWAELEEAVKKLELMAGRITLPACSGMWLPKFWGWM